jgi:hypothetical protein
MKHFPKFFAEMGQLSLYFIPYLYFMVEDIQAWKWWFNASKSQNMLCHWDLGLDMDLGNFHQSHYKYFFLLSDWWYDFYLSLLKSLSVYAKRNKCILNF